MADGILERIAERKAAWEAANPDRNAFIVALGDKAAHALKLTLPDAKRYDAATITLSARVLGLHVEEDSDLPADAIEVR